MKSTLIALLAALALAACGDGSGDADVAHDTTATPHHDTATTGMPTSGGDMTAQMAEMNRMMTAMLGAADSAYERRYIDLMVPHHQGAIMMAQDALGKAQHAELKSFAQEIITEQQREIAELKRMRQEWYGDSTVAPMSASMHGGAPGTEGMQMDMHAMDQRMMMHLGAADSTYDRRLIDMMIPHHEGAVMMSRDALEKATRRELRDFATKIIADQNTEIGQLTQWRRQWYGDHP